MALSEKDIEFIKKIAKETQELGELVRGFDSRLKKLENPEIPKELRLRVEFELTPMDDAKAYQQDFVNTMNRVLAQFKVKNLFCTFSK